MSGIQRLFVSDMSVDNQGMSTRCQHVGSDDGDIVPLTVVEGRCRVDDD